MASPVRTPHPKPAQRTQRKARLGLWGKAGSGKTLTALRIARGLAGPDGKIVVLDTEFESSTIYADLERFDLVPIPPPYDPVTIAEVVKAVAPHYDVVILDSASHEWAGDGGCLAQIDVEKAKLGDNAWAAWSKVTPKHNRFVEALIHCPAHLIVCLRAKTKTARQRNPETKKWEIVELGDVPIQREELPYELDILARLDPEGDGVRLSVTKTRYLSWHGQSFPNPDARLGVELAAWLSKGVTPAQDPSPDEGHPFAAPDQPATAASQGPAALGTLLNRIQKGVFHLVPGKTEADNRTRRALLQECFAKDNMTDVGKQPIEVLQSGLKRLQAKAKAAKRREPGQEG
jgi:hypothetical protein